MAEDRAVSRLVPNKEKEMSGIYIPNMEMPKDGHFLQILIAENGDISYEYVSYNSPHMGFTLHKSKAIEVPTHGDLVDRQKLIKALSKAWDVDDDQDFANKSVWRIVEKEASTIIEASKERE